MAAGGDGTAGLIGKELLGTDVALGIMPLGSVMNIARMLGLPRELPGCGAGDRGTARGDDRCRRGERRDLLRRRERSGSRRPCFGTRTNGRAAIWGSLFRAVREAFRYMPGAMELTLDDEPRIDTRALMVTVSNAPYVGVGMTVAPDARLDDGVFDVVVWEHFSKARAVPPSRVDLRLAGGATRRIRRRIAPRASAVVGRRPLPARVDAHDLGTTPLECHDAAAGAARRGRPGLCQRPRPVAAASPEHKKRPRQLALPRPSSTGKGRASSAL